MNKLLKNIYIIAGILAVILLISFGSKNQNSNPIWDLKIELKTPTENILIFPEELKSNILQSYPGLLGLDQKKLEISRIQTILDNHPLVKNGNVHKTVDGIIKIKAEQRLPFLRIINEESFSFLVDKDGVKMPILPTKNPRLTLFTGRINEALDGTSMKLLNVNKSLRDASIFDEIFQLATFLDASDFWKHQVEHVYVNAEQEFELVPRVGNHKILIGSASNVENKLKRLERFYKETINKENWNEYTAIDLRFDNQVVCKKLN